VENAEDAPNSNGEKNSDAFEWRVRLSDKAPEKRAGVFAAAALAAAVGWFVFRTPVMGGIGFAIILGSTAEYWLGSSFRLDERGASSRTGFSLASIEWANVKRLIREKQGIRLSPLETPGTMDAFRGVFLRYGEGNQKEIEGAVLRFGGTHTALVGGLNGSGLGPPDRQDGDGDLSPEDAGARDHDPGNG